MTCKWSNASLSIGEFNTDLHLPQSELADTYSSINICYVDEINIFEGTIDEGGRSVHRAQV